MGIPLVALQGQGPEIAKSIGDIIPNQLAQRAKQQDLQINNLKIQAAQRQLASQAASQRAFKDSGGDPEKYFQLSTQYGVAPDDVDKQMAALDNYKKAGLARTDEQQKQAEAQTKAVGDALAGVRALPEEARAAALPKAVQGLVDNKWLPPDKAQPLMTYQGPEWLDQMGTQYNFHAQVEKQIADQRASAAEKRAQEKHDAEKAAGTLGGALKEPTGVVQEYNIYAQQQKDAGKTPLGIDEYIDARAKAKPTSEPLVAVQTDNGVVYKPRSQAAGEQKPQAPEEVRKVQENQGMVTDTLTRAQNVRNNADKLASMLDAGRISFAIGGDGTLKTVIGKGITLTPAEAKMAADFQSLTEGINLLRQPLGAAGFRSEQAFEALQAQKGRLYQNLDVFKNVLDNTIQSFGRLKDANSNALKRMGIKEEAPKPANRKSLDEIFQ